MYSIEVFYLLPGARKVDCDYWSVPADAEHIPWIVKQVLFVNNKYLELGARFVIQVNGKNTIIQDPFHQINLEALPLQEA